MGCQENVIILGCRGGFRVLLLFALATFFAGPLFAQNVDPGPVQRFVYRHTDGLQYHILAQVDEQVFLNRKLVYNTRILNRIAVEVAELRQNGESALLDVNYQISEEARNGRFFSWGKEIGARFEMSEQGIYSGVDEEAQQPSLRNVPSFPDRELSPGEGWRAIGNETQDLNEIFGLPVKLEFEFPVDYLYRGPEQFQGRELEHITIVYGYNEDVSSQLPAALQSRLRTPQPPMPGDSPRSQRLPEYRSPGASSRGKQPSEQQQNIPRSVRARHNIELYWDSERGLPVFEKEKFEISYLMQSGVEITFRGHSRGNIIEVEPMRHQNLKRELEEDLQKAGIDAQVRQKDKGISISIDSINFYPDSDRMLPGEQRKLQQISRILQKYPKRDIQVTGHTADLGKPEEQQTLSEKRAGVVGRFFIENGVRRREQIVIRGVGATEPLAPNNTPQGRKQNRRVEITLLEN